MTEQVFNLDNTDNFTEKSGLVQEIEQGGWRLPWRPLVGRPKSTVYVFNASTRSQLYKLAFEEQVELKNKMTDMLRGVKYAVYAASEQHKTLRFKTEFMLGDTTIPDMILELQISTNRPDDTVIAVVEGGDPVKELCHSVKSKLDSSLLGSPIAEDDLQDINSLQQFVDSVGAVVNDTKVDHPYLSLEKITAQGLLKSVTRVLQESQKQKREEAQRRQRAIENPEEEVRKIEQEYRLKKLEKRLELELNEFELKRLGITDARIRLIMGDPDNRAQYLKELYQQQMALFVEGQKQDRELHDLRLEIIRAFQERVLDEHSNIDDLRQILILTDKSTTAQPREFLNSVIPDGEQQTIVELTDNIETNQ